MAKWRPDLSSGLDLTDIETNKVSFEDGITAPDTVAGRAIIYVDSADGNLKIKFGDGTVARIATDVDVQSIQVTPLGDKGASSSVGGAINLNNTANPGAGMVIYSNEDGDATGHLLVLRADNSNFDLSALFIDYDGKVNALNINSKGTGTAQGALNVGSTNDAESTLKVSGVESGKGTVKVTHTKPSGSDANAAGFSIELAGAGTACQGLFIDSSGGTTGKLINLRDQGNEKFVVKADGNIDMAALPTSDPSVAGRLWIDTSASRVLKVSAG